MPREFTQVTPNLWLAQSPLFHTNSGIFISDGQACLIDPAIYPDEISAIARFVRPLAAMQAIITHSHWDHVLGPEHFPGVPIIAQANYTRSLVTGAAAEIAWSIAEFEVRENITRDQPFVIPVPSQTFDVQTDLTIGNLTLRLSYMPGHTDDALVVYHGVSGTLWAGDMLSDLEIPYVQVLSDYEHSLAQLAAWDIRILVPGHGNVTSDPAEIKARIVQDRAYLAELRTNVERTVYAGHTLAETIEICSSVPVRHQDADNIAGHRANIEAAYGEISG